MNAQFSVHKLMMIIEMAIDGKMDRNQALWKIEEMLKPLVDAYDTLIEKLNDEDDQAIDQTIMVGALVKTNHEFSKYFRGKCLEGRVIDYDERSGVVTFLTEHGREMLHDHWLMVTGG